MPAAGDRVTLDLDPAGLPVFRCEPVSGRPEIDLELQQADRHGGG